MQRHLEIALAMSLLCGSAVAATPSCPTAQDDACARIARDSGVIVSSERAGATGLLVHFDSSRASGTVPITLIDADGLRCLGPGPEPARAEDVIDAEGHVLFHASAFTESMSVTADRGFTVLCLRAPDAAAREALVTFAVGKHALVASLPPNARVPANDNASHREFGGTESPDFASLAALARWVARPDNDGVLEVFTHAHAAIAITRRAQGASARAACALDVYARTADGWKPVLRTPRWQGAWPTLRQSGDAVEIDLDDATQELLRLSIRGLAARG